MLLICVLLAVAFAFGCKVPLKKAPWVFYLLAVALDVLVVFAAQLDAPQWVYRSVILANGRCLFAFGLFTVVMFIGVLKDGSKAKRWLTPVRAELSIVASILAVGHMVRYINVYSPRVIASPSSLANGMLLSFVIAMLIGALLVLLAVTSFKVVKRHMSARVWKNIQRLAYPFFVLIYAHVLLIMLRPAMAGAPNAQVSLVVYGAIVVAYVVLRVARWRASKAHATAAQPVSAAPAATA